MAKYRKKPVVIDAVLLENNYKSIYWAIEFVHDIGMETSVPMANETVKRAQEAGGVKIETLEGDMLARFGDFIIKGVNGEFYPCKPDIFAKTYDEVKPVDTQGGDDYRETMYNGWLAKQNKDSE